jgi:hypothetical protein
MADSLDPSLRGPLDYVLDRLPQVVRPHRLHEALAGLEVVQGAFSLSGRGRFFTNPHEIVSRPTSGHPGAIGPLTARLGTALASEIASRQGESARREGDRPSVPT